MGIQKYEDASIVVLVIGTNTNNERFPLQIVSNNAMLSKFSSYESVPEMIRSFLDEIETGEDNNAYAQENYVHDNREFFNNPLLNIENISLLFDLSDGVRRIELLKKGNIAIIKNYDDYNKMKIRTRRSLNHLKSLNINPSNYHQHRDQLLDKLISKTIKSSTLEKTSCKSNSDSSLIKISNDGEENEIRSQKDPEESEIKSVKTDFEKRDQNTGKNFRRKSQGSIVNNQADIKRWIAEDHGKLVQREFNTPNPRNQLFQEGNAFFDFLKKMKIF